MGILDFLFGRKGDIYSYYAKARNHIDNKEYNLAVKNFDTVMKMLPKQPGMTSEIMNSTVFATEDMSIAFTMADLFHLRGCAKFYMSDFSSIEDFNESIKINENYENAYYMRGCAYFIISEDWQKSLTDIKKYLTFNPDDEAGNNMLLVLEEIKSNSSKVSKFFNEAVQQYSKGMQSQTDEEAVIYFKKSKENLENALNFYTQKNRVYIYQKSHSFSLCDIYFKILQCNLSLGGRKIHERNTQELMTDCVHIYKISKGKFKPNNDELGAQIYSLVEKANS